MGNCPACFNKPAQQTPVSGSAPTLEEDSNREQTQVSGPTPTVETAIEQQTSAHTVEEVINSLTAVSDTTDLNRFVEIIKKLLEEKSDRGSTSKSAEKDKGNISESAQEKGDKWASFISSGAKFLQFLNGHTQKIEDKKDIFYSGNSRVVVEILGQIGQLHWAAGGLAVTAYLIEKIQKVSANKAEALDLLSKMVDLATTIIKLRDVIPEDEERLKKAVMLVVQASIMCVSQIHSEKLFSFFKTSVNSQNLKEMSNALKHLYGDLTFSISSTIAKRQLEIAKHHSMRLSEIAERQSEMAERQAEIAKGQPFYPRLAAGEGSDVTKENLSRRLIADFIHNQFDEDKKAAFLDFIYNEFDDDTQDAFLDMCCFFNGWLRRHVEYVVGAEEVQALEEAALLSPFVDDNDRKSIYSGEERLKVHDIVRAKGRAMSASTRFTDVKSFREAALDETKLRSIKGLWLDEREEYVVDVKHLNSMRHSLRILHLGGNVRTSAQSPMKFKKLRYLYDGPPIKVQEHDMLGWMKGRINGMSVKQFPKRLSYLCTKDMNTMESSSTQGIQNHSVEELRLSEGPKMEQVPEGLHQLSSLKFLSLYWFDEMEEFPEEVCKLSSLTRLHIDAWKRLKRLPQSFGRLKGLTHLKIDFCKELEELPSSFGELTALEHLDLSFCSKLKQELPPGLESLKYLDVFGCKKLSVESYRRKANLRIEE